MGNDMVREQLKDLQLVVIKVGSKVLLESDGRPNYPQIAALVAQIAALHKNKKIIFVSSGAIGAGMEALSLKRRPTDLPTLQAAASIGQVRLMRAYEDLFASFGCMVAQVLLTHDDLKNRKRHVNIRHTLTALLEKNVIPIINENDAVSTDEIKFGDNDILASLVALLLEAKALILLTTAEGFMVTTKSGKKERLSHIIELNESVLQHIESHKTGLSVGGMKSKLTAAANMIHVGGVAVIAPGHHPRVLEYIVEGENIGTVVGPINPNAARRMPGRKRWIAFYQKPSGALIVDAGAQDAMVKGGKSLLSVGIKAIAGIFDKGAVVEVHNAHGTCFAKGITQLSHEAIASFIKAAPQKNSPQSHEVIHRDNLVILHKEP